VTEEQVQSRTTSSARLRFVLGDHGVDIAVPTEVALADLLPAVLTQFGAETVEEGAEHEGWIVQRLGSAALDEDLTPRQLDLHDGEQLYLRPRADELAPIDYDDIVAGVGEQVRSHRGAWTPGRTRTMLLAGATAMLLLGVPVLLFSGASGLAAGLAGGTAAFLLAGSALVARGSTDTVAATVIVGVSAVYAAAGAAMVAVGVGGGSPMVVLTAVSAALVAVLAIGVVLVADSALLFAGALLFGVVLAVTGVIGSVWAMPPSQAAAIVLAVTLIVGLFLPSAAFRLSGLSLPLLPTAPDELAEDITPVPHRLVIDRGRATAGYSGALHAGLGAAQLLLVLPVVAAGGWYTIYGSVVGLLLFLRSRHPELVLPRWSMLVPAAAAVVMVPFALAPDLSPVGRVGVLWIPALAIGGAMLALVDVMPGRRMLPYWGRTVDLLESFSAVAVLPLLLAAMDVYSTIRGMAS
jgi:type VII secretion integral membrane protein EccD